MPGSVSRGTLIVLILWTAVCPVFSLENSTVLYRKAALTAAGGKYDEAVNEFLKVIKVNPSYALGHYGLGKLYLYRENKIKDAVKHLEQAVRCDRGFAKAYFYLGMAYMLEKKYSRAAGAFTTAYNLDRGMYEALFNLSIIYDTINNRYLSRRYYDRYLLEKQKRELDILF